MKEALKCLVKRFDHLTYCALVNKFLHRASEVRLMKHASDTHISLMNAGMAAQRGCMEIQRWVDVKVMSPREPWPCL